MEGGAPRRRIAFHGIRWIPWLFGCAVFAGCTMASASPVTLDVTVKITDFDYKGLPGVAGRLVFASDPRWQSPTAGTPFVTDADGVARITATVGLEKGWRKYPTNFIASLLSSAQPAEHLIVAADLEYAGMHALYTLDIVHFQNDDTMLDDYRVYTADQQGHFTQEAKSRGNDWEIPAPDGMVLSAPGFEAWDYLVTPDATDPAGKRWTLRLGFKKRPEPIRR